MTYTPRTLRRALGRDRLRPRSGRPGLLARTPRAPGGRAVSREPARGGGREGAKIPPPAPGDIRIIPLGGVEEIGKNMTLVETSEDILVLDMGFQFKEEDTPGIDYILPNTKYLEERKEKIRAVIITHGHLDHIGGVPYLMPRIGYPPLYTRNLTAIMIKKRQAEFPHLKNLDIRIIEKDDHLKIGALSVSFFNVTHTIPDSMGIVIETSYGLIVNPGDFKLDHVDEVPTASEEEAYRIFDKKKVLLLITDSTNIENPGFSTPESVVHKNLEEIIKNIKGRIIIGTFASQLARMIHIIKIAEKYGKKVVIEGRSMKVNIEVAETSGMLTVKKGTIIPAAEMSAYPPDKIVVLATGAQGEEFAALMRMGTKAHKTVQINNRDTVILSSSIIPGNEKTVEKLKDNLARQGAKIIHYRTSEVYIHSTGHGNRGEIEWLHRRLKPKFFIPIHGNHYRLRLHAELARDLGTPEKNVIVPDNGSIIEITNKGERMTVLKEKAPASPVMVDGFSVGDIQEVVLRDRQMLAEDGMFVIIGSVNTQTGKLKKSPDIISRGFVYLRESQDLLRQTRYIIKKTIEDAARGMNPINFDYVKNQVTDNVSRYLFQQTAKRPIVIPVILGV
ncbi:MAG: ribonuclease J [Candidatus Taylorbacteria bacterium]|nr:ribonuclease J [Candidatus Taylorbacteria bacterium]